MVPWAWRDCSAEGEVRIRREEKRMWKKVGKSLAERQAEMRQKLANYKLFRELSEEWVDLALELKQVEREQSR
jgi:hypothetical protein